MSLGKRTASAVVAAVIFTATLPVITSHGAESSDGTIFGYDGNKTIHNSWGKAGTGYGALTNDTDGDAGKAVSDVYGTATVETSGEWRYVVQSDAWSADGKGNNTHLIMTAQIKPTADITKINFNTNGSAAIAPASDTAIIDAWNLDEWNLITVVYEYSNSVAKTYVNGEYINSDNTKNLTPGSNRLQLSVYGAEGTTFGIDNVKYYHSMSAAVPAMPVAADSERYTVSGSNIYVGENVKAADITSPGNDVRIYTGDTYSTQVEASQTLTANMKAVVESPDGMMKYYTVKTATKQDILKVDSNNTEPYGWTDNAKWTDIDVKGKSGASAVTDGTTYSGVLSGWIKQSTAKYVVASAQIMSDGAVTNAAFKADTSSITGDVSLLQGKWNNLTVVYDIENQSSKTYLNGALQGTSEGLESLLDSAIVLDVETADGTVGIDNIYIYQTNVKPVISAPELITGANYAIEGDIVKIKQGDDVNVDKLECTAGAAVRAYTSEYILQNDGLANDDIVVVEKDNIFVYYTVTETVPAAITVMPVTNGTVTASKAEAFTDEEVTITVIPDSDYEVSSITVTDDDDVNVTVTDNSDGTYTFIMPDKAVTISVEITAMPEYTITVSDTIKNGTVTVDKTSSVKGRTITVTAAAKKGYTLKDGSLKANGSVIANGTFIMPEEDVTITAEFEPKLIDNENIVDLPDTIAFNFNNSDEGFTRTGASLEITDDALKATVTGKDNYLTKEITPINGGEYYGISIRMKHENCTNSGAYAAPTMKMMYDGGAGLSMNEGRAAEITLSVTDEDGDGRYDSDGYVTYFIDTSKVTGWSTATAISKIRFDLLKGQTDGVGGTVYIDYIKLIKTPSVDAVGGDGSEKSQRAQADAETLDFFFSTPIDSEGITPDNVKIYNELDNEVKIKEVTYESAENRLKVTPLENIKADTCYVFEINNVNVNGNQHSVNGVFKTDGRVIQVSEPEKSGNILKFNVTNASLEKDILIVCAVYQGDVFKEYKAVKHTAQSGSTACSVTLASIPAGAKVESYVYEYVNGMPKLILNDIYITN